MVGPCSPKHSSKFFTVLKDRFVWMLCNQIITFKLMAGPRSSTSPVMAQLHLRHWKIISFWCCEDFQQSSKERKFVLPQTRCSFFHGVEELFCRNGMKLFKNIGTYGFAVLPQTRPSFVHAVENSMCMVFCRHVKTFKFMAWPRSPTSRSRPSSFCGVEESFRFDVVQTFNNV